jgi:serine/threonine-protein kinase
MSALAPEQGIGAGVCAKCGKSITHPGPDGECVRCLVSFGFLSEDDEPQQSRESKEMRLGPLRYAHFEVEVNPDGYPVILGSGAMAVTYRARDTVLNSAVALKVISRKLAEDPTARARFLREARAAAQIQHPNVARVIHYGEQDGECFYAMELVHGETLEARVQRDGPLPLSLALDVVEQTARGLAAGEKCGVIHRDLKPSNLMLESHAGDQLLVKIIDYGVAKVLAPQADATYQTQAGFIGTPAFASPEQFDEAGRQQIDTRSDIYSLGVTFWYLLTAQMPFFGRSLEEVRAKQAAALPMHQLKSAHVPAKVVALLESMLAVDPARRPQNAIAFLALVHRCYLRFEPAARSRRKQVLFAAGGLALAIAVVSLAILIYQRAQSISALDRSIAVLPFENQSSNADDQFFAVGIREELMARLAHVSSIQLIGAQSTRSYAPGAPRDVAKIGRELGARYLLEGTVWRGNDQVRLSLRLLDLRHPDKPWTVTYERSMKDVFAMESEIAHAIAEQLQTEIPTHATATLDTPPTNDLQAYDFYLRALAVPRQVKDPAENIAMHEKKIALFEQAVAHDPNFVLAYCELAQEHDRISREKRAASPGSTVDHRALAEAALEKARLLAPDAGPLHLAQAYHLYVATGDFEQARAELDLARRTLPNNSELEQLGGSIARRQGHWEEAVQFFQKAAALEPRDTEARFALAGTYRLMRRYDDFDREMVKVIGFMSKKESASYRLARALGPWEARGEVTPLRIALSTITEDEDQDGRLRDRYGVVLALADRDPDAVSRILAHASDAAFISSGVKYPKAWYEGLAARIRHDQATAHIAFETARAEVERATLANPADALALGLLAMIDAGLGQNEQAIAEAKRAAELLPFEKSALEAPVARSDLAAVYAWTDHSDLAVAELDSLADKPAGFTLPARPTYGDFKLNAVWDPLRSYPGFTKLMEKFAPRPAP